MVHVQSRPARGFTNNGLLNYIWPAHLNRASFSRTLCSLLTLIPSDAPVAAPSPPVRETSEKDRQNQGTHSPAGKTTEGRKAEHSGRAQKALFQEGTGGIRTEPKPFSTCCREAQLLQDPAHSWASTLELRRRAILNHGNPKPFQQYQPHFKRPNLASFQRRGGRGWNPMLSSLFQAFFSSGLFRKTSARSSGLPSVAEVIKSLGGCFIASGSER